MIYLGNNTNILAAAIVTALNVVPSDEISRIDAATEKTGGGDVVLSGPYTGAEDATVEVEILNNTIAGDPRISQPVPRCVGNGTLTDLAADAGVDAQTITVVLVDRGTETRQAFTVLDGVTLRARASGTSGNAITVTIDETDLVRTATNFALLDSGGLQAGVNEYVGDEHNFGAQVLNPDGTVNAAAPRLAFGSDPQVYRQWKAYRDGRYVYGYSPAPQRDVPAGARVRLVSGGRTVTVTDGDHTDVYTNVTTLYSLLAQIQADADGLLEVVGPVVQDYAIGGMGITDIVTRTAAYVKSLTADGGDAVRRADFDLEVAANAPTEDLVIACIDPTTLGAEQFSVKGTVSGELPRAVTGQLYEHGGYAFVIPRVESDQQAASAGIWPRFEPVERTEGPQPGCQFVRAVLGSNASDKELTFVYREIPAPACDPREQPMTGGPNADCLGLVPEEDGMANDPRHQLRLERITRDLAKYTQEQSWSFDSSIAVPARTAVARLLSQTLSRMFNSGEVDTPAWAAATVYEAGDIVRKVASNGLRYIATVGGTSHATTEPTFPTTIGATVTDNGVTWTCLGQEALTAFDAVLDIVDDDFTIYEDSGLNQILLPLIWEAEEPKARGLTIYPTELNGFIYVAVQAGATGTTEPETWPTTIGATVTDGTVVWRCLKRYWQASTAVALGTFGYIGVASGPNAIWAFRVKTAGGNTGSTEPNWEEADYGDVTDGAVVWEPVQITDLSEEEPQAYLGRITNLLLPALVAAGIDPTFEEAGTAGSPCWPPPPPGATHWLVCQTEPSYKPIIPGRYYHSAREVITDGVATIESTREFGIGVKLCNAEVGDLVIIRIQGAGGGRAYQQGDRFAAQIVRAQPLALGGGQTGTDTLTFSVTGSVDGGFANYALSLVTPAAYDNGGLSFLITPGGIPFQLGDTFTFSIEGGQFRWRIDGGSWSSATQIDESVALDDGLFANFLPGESPSFVPGDVYTFAAIATNGASRVKQPIAGALATDDATEIDVETDDPEPVRFLMIEGHAIPSGATIRWHGSNDDFATTPMDEAITWRAGAIAHVLASPATYAKYRLEISQAFDAINWIYMGLGTLGALPDGQVEWGLARKLFRLPGALSRAGVGARAEHNGLTKASADAILAMLSHASEHDEGLIGLIVNDGEPEHAGLVVFEGDLEMSDHFDFEPPTVADRLIAISLELQAAP